MTENLYHLIMILLDVANESAAKDLGYKGKPYLYYGDLAKYGFNIKKQDLKKFSEIHKRITGDDESLEDVIKNRSSLIEYFEKYKK